MREPHWVSLRAAAAEAQRAARKQLQRQAYLRAKERRANDPRLQQLKLQQKEAAKARRREHYQRVKEHRKAAKAAGKAARSAERASAESAERSFFAKGRVSSAEVRAISSRGSASPLQAELLREPAARGSVSREPAARGSVSRERRLVAAFADAEAANDVR